MKWGAFAVGLLVLASVRPVYGQEPARSSSTADDQEARRLFEAGQVAYEGGNFDRALQYFMRAHELSHRPRMLYNIGQAADRLRRDRTALQAFKLYLQELPDAENAEMVRNRITVLEQAVSDADAQGDLSATATARAAPTNDSDAAHLNNASDQAGDTRPIYTQWWFLTGAGVVVVAALVTVIAIGSSGDSYAPSPAGTDGITVTALVGQ